jgi:hypothetical protein
LQDAINSHPAIKHFQNAAAGEHSHSLDELKSIRRANLNQRKWLRLKFAADDPLLGDVLKQDEQG